jgi:hypothetical protein
MANANLTARNLIGRNANRENANLADRTMIVSHAPIVKHVQVVLKEKNSLKMENV